MKRILFPTDFSPTATNAFVHALEFAKMVQGELILLHTFELPVYDSQFFPQNYMVLYESLELSQFDMFKEEIPKLRAIAAQRNLDGIKMTHRLMEGGLVYAIEKAIKEDQIDYVVMGTEGGSTGWTSFFSETNTANVLTNIEVPLLSVPSEAVYKPIDTIGFTTRFRKKDKKALKKVLKIAKFAGAEVKCLYVQTSESDVDKTTIQKWEEDFKDEAVSFFVVPSDEIKASILDFIAYKEVDVLTMLTYKRGFFEGIMNPSLTKKFSKTFEIPILSIAIKA
ncbi:universal stress protein [Flavobacterium crassostreae]|uniref:Universal stress protein UspA n=1 Tax=Flavobacterium crassostreae TaxID=1763534 RepID=A0A1B9EA77_9FLAO|nr:universal stress protein [Flavobacterium crassostreae]OCB78837.1 universal stress protein UspA [Flavobacterium crassostreae]